MPNKKKPYPLYPLVVATFAALAVILWGALFLIAPVWQFSAPPAAYIAPSADGEVVVDSSQAETLIDINTATEQELDRLPGIGPAKAAAIVAYRESHGPFTCLEEVTQVSGISASMVEQWAGLATVHTPGTTPTDFQEMGGAGFWKSRRAFLSTAN